MQKNAKIYVAGHRGLVGSAIVRKLEAEGYTNVIGQTSDKLDLRNQASVDDFFDRQRPEYIFMAAAKVGGVLANSTEKAEFIYDNIAIQTNVIHNAHVYGTKKLLFLGSNCLYPVYCAQPIKESYLLAGQLEPTTEAYAIAKIAGIKMCEAYREQYCCNFITALPVNMYGPNDNYDLQSSHVMPAIMKKMDYAKTNGHKTVPVWGTGGARREFMHVDDLADACLFLMLNYNGKEPVNVGTGEDIKIRELAEMIKDVFEYNGDIVFDPSKPEGIQKKLLDVSKIHALGWHHKIGLREGIQMMYEYKFGGQSIGGKSK